MNLEVVVSSVAPFKATISSEGVVDHIVEFKPRPDNADSLIASLPKAFRDLGSATNITIKKSEFTVGAVITRNSLAGKSSPRSSHAAIDIIKTLPRVNADGQWQLWLITSKSESVICDLPTGFGPVFTLAKQVSDYLASMTTYGNELAKWQTMVNNAVAYGLPLEKAAEVFPAPVQPDLPTFVVDAPKAKKTK